MERILLLFPFNHPGKTDLLIEEFLQNPQKTLYITSHISKIDDFQLRFYRIKKSSILPQIFTLKNFAQKLIYENSPKRIISEVEKFIKIVELVKKNRVETNIPGIAQAICNFIKDIKISFENEVDISFVEEKVKTYPWKYPENAEQIMMAVKILKEYQQYLEENNLIDSEDIYRESSKFVKGNIEENVIFEGIYEIPYYQRNFVKEIIQNSQRTIFSILYDKKASVDVREKIIEKTVSFLEEVTRWEKREFLSSEKNENVECYHFPSVEEEVKGMVKLILEYLKSGISYEEIMLVFPNMPQYRPTIKRIFSRYSLPVEMIPGYILREEPSVNSLLEIFNFVESFSWENLMSIISSPYFKNFDFEEVKKFSEYSRKEFESRGFFKEDLDFEKWENLKLLEKSVSLLDGKISISTWINRLKRIIEILKWEPQDTEIKIMFENMLEGLKSSARITRQEFYNLLLKSLELIEVERGKGRGIKVSGVLETAGLEKKICFVGGATEENMPTSPHLVEIFLPENLKKELNLTDYEMRIARERFDLYRIKNENEKVIFTYPLKIQERNQMKTIFLFKTEDLPLKNEIFTYIPKEIFKFNFSWEKFEKKFLKDDTYHFAITSLEKFFKCSYRFYLEEVEGIEVYKEPEIEEVPRIWGRIIHITMEKIFIPLCGKIMDEASIKEAISRFIETGLNYIEHPELIEERKLPYLLKKAMEERIEEVSKKLERIMEKHRNHKLLSVEKPVSIKVGNIEINGKVDREEEKNGEIEIIDIKTSTLSPPSYTEDDFFRKGNVQIPLYLWIYWKKTNSIPLGIIWQLSFKEESEIFEKEYQSSKFEKYFDKIEEFLINFAKSLKERKVSFLPSENVECFGCPLKGYCKYGKN